MRSSLRNRRHRNPQIKESERQQPFFTKSNSGLLQKKEDNIPFFQAKLSIGKPGDKYEQEADSVASQVVDSPNSSPYIQQKEISTIQRSTISENQEEEPVQSLKEEEEPAQMMSFTKNKEDKVQTQVKEEEEPIQKMEGKEEEEPVQMMSSTKKEEDEVQTQVKEEEEPIQKKGSKEKEEEEPIQKMEGKEEEELQMKAEAGKQSTAPQLGSRIKNKSGKGKPIPKKHRSEMENSFGVDFGGVKIHTDAVAVQMNKELGAQAFTNGKDIYFNSGKYHPESAEGKRLLAHELTHVIQQNSSSQEKQIQRKIEDGHDLTAQQLAGDSHLESAFDGEFIFRKNRFAPHISIRKLQQALIEVGQRLPKFGIDGHFGDETEKAVRSFQQESGLSGTEIDGRVGPQTMALLNNHLTSKSPKVIVPAINELKTLEPGKIGLDGTDNKLPNLDVKTNSEQEISPTLSGNNGTDINTVDIKAGVELGINLFSKGDNNPNEPIDPCRLAQVKSHISGELQIKGIGIGKRMNLLYNQPQLKLTLPSSPCNNLPELSIETNIVKFEAVPKILELSLKPILTLKEGQLTPGASVEAEFTPFGNSNNFLSKIKISGGLDLNSEKKENSSERVLEVDGIVGNLKFEF